MKARPKSIEDFEFFFYNNLLLDEKAKLESSKRFYYECIDEADRKLKEELHEYVDAYIESLQNKIYELYPRENQINGLGGLSQKQATILFEHFKDKYIHPMSSKTNFIAVFQTIKLPYGWVRIDWIGFKSDLITFMDQVFGRQVQPQTIKKYFKVEGDNLYSHHRLTKTSFNLKNILESTNH